MSDIEYSVITSDVIKSFDCTKFTNLPFFNQINTKTELQFVNVF